MMMLQKEKKQNNPKATTLKKIVILIVSWTVTLLFAIGLLIIVFATAHVMERSDFEPIEGLLIFMMTTVVFVLLFFALHRFREVLFIKYTRVALAVGSLGMVGLLLLVMIGSTTILFNEHRSGHPSMLCSDLDDKLIAAQAATYPIATDLGTGTAFAIDEGGSLLTAYHVVEGAGEVYVSFVDDKIPLEVYAIAPELDIALLKMNSPTPDYLNLTSDYHVANPLYAVGYPANSLHAGQASVSGGILSRVLTNEDVRLNNEAAPSQLEIIQTDTALNPGNSGGPLFNRCGVVGVVSAKSDSLQMRQYGLSSEEGISFAVSSKTVAERFSLPISSP